MWLPSDAPKQPLLRLGVAFATDGVDSTCLLQHHRTPAESNAHQTSTIMSPGVRKLHKHRDGFGLAKFRGHNDGTAKQTDNTYVSRKRGHGYATSDTQGVHHQLRFPPSMQEASFGVSFNRWRSTTLNPPHPRFF